MNLDHLMPEDLRGYDQAAADAAADRADMDNDEAWLAAREPAQKPPVAMVAVTADLIEALDRATSRREIAGAHQIELVALLLQLRLTRRATQRSAA